jgi:DNA polymerase III delta prime subunit
MNWIEPAIEAVSTSEIIYYSEKYAHTCSRICQILQIDLFPDSNHKDYWHLEDQQWHVKSITEEQAVNSSLRVFNESVLQKMEASPSNLLFSYTGSPLSGIVHFTNYANQQTYQSLYQNFYEFETSLREYLSHLGFTYEDVEKYYEYSLAKRDKPFFRDRLEQLRSEKFRNDAKELPNLQKLDLKEAIIFSISSYHTKDIKNKIGLSKINEPQISNLRNTIMHAKEITGSNSELAHNFSSFKKFFSEVLSFKDAFMTLKKLRAKQIYELNIKFNDYTLALLESLADEEIKMFFYTRR